MIDASLSSPPPAQHQPASLDSLDAISTKVDEALSKLLSLEERLPNPEISPVYIHRLENELADAHTKIDSLKDNMKMIMQTIDFGFSEMNQSLESYGWT